MALSPSELLATNTFLSELRDDPRFQAVVAELETMRPVVPSYLPGAAKEGNDVAIEKIKFAFGEQRGFDKILALLTGKPRS